MNGKLNQPMGYETTAVNRRSFLAQAATMGLAAPAMLAPALAAPLAAQETPESTEVPTPAGLGPHGMLDNRFPESFQVSVPQGVRLVTQFFTALSERNLKGITDLLHFPFASIEETEPIVIQTPDELLAHAPASINMSLNPERFTDHDGYLKPGAYDVLTGVEVLNFDPVVAGLALTYNRYDSNGKKLLRCQGVYSVTNNDGRWAIQMMSTIFTPAHMVDLTFSDTIEQAKRCRINHDLAYDVCNRSLDATTSQLGSTVGVLNVGGQPWTLGPNGHAMEQFKIKGVKSRLRVSTVTDASLAKMQSSADPIADYADYRALFPKTGIGNWGWVYGMLPETRVLHANFNKAHMFSGAMRFNVSGDEFSYNTDLSVVTFKNMRWGRAGTLAYTTPHDRSNDVLRAKA